MNFTEAMLAEQNRPNMKKNNLIRFMQSLVLMPVITTSFSLGGMQNIETSQNLLVQKINIEARDSFVFNQTAVSEAELLKSKAKAIDTYFESRNMPLEGMGMKMVEEAEKNGLDWRLLAAISVRESTGGKKACIKVKNNAFGWGSCKIGFKSTEEAIATVAKNLGGNNPKTAYHYDDKTTVQILRAYNPPSIVPRYAEQVISIMNSMGDEDMTATFAVNL
jgi:hypothetical protein